MYRGDQKHIFFCSIIYAGSVVGYNWHHIVVCLSVRDTLHFG